MVKFILQSLLIKVLQSFNYLEFSGPGSGANCFQVPEADDGNLQCRILLALTLGTLYQHLSKFFQQFPVFADGDPGAREGSQFAPGKLSNKSSSGIFQRQAGNAGRAVGCRSVWVPLGAHPSYAVAGISAPSGRGLRRWTRWSCHEDNAYELTLTCQETDSVSLCITSD